MILAQLASPKSTVSIMSGASGDAQERQTVIKYCEQSDGITWKQRYGHHHSTNEFALSSAKDQSEALFWI